MAITMETDWGAKGAQLTGGQVQTFIKEQLVALQEKDKELQQKIEAVGPTPEGEQLKTELEEVKKKIQTLETQLTQIDVTPDWLETDQSSKSYIKNKPEIPTLDHEPGESDKSYTNVDQTVVSFKVGDLARHQDQDGNYKFYQVLDIKPDGSVVWGMAGGGSGEADLRETVTVKVVSNQAQPDESLKGAKVKVAGTDGTSFFDGTWNGEPINVKVTPMTEYTVSVSDVEEYATPVAQRYTSAIQGKREVMLMYNCCILTVNIAGLDSSSVQATVSYDSVSKKLNSGETIKVPYGKEVTVTCPEADGYTKPEDHVYTPSQSSHVITMTYIPTSLRLHIESNQPDKSDLSGLKATATYAGGTFQIGNDETVGVPVNTEITLTFPEVEGYKKPENIVFTNPGGLVEKTGTYETEVVTVTLLADDGKSVDGQIVTINGQQHTWNGTAISQKIPFGAQYKVSVNKKEEYDSPAEQTFTASIASRNVEMKYIYNPIKLGYFILDDTINDPATKITQTPDGERVVKWIRENSHRVLARKVAEGKCRVIQLMDNDTTKYFDGQSAPITSTNYDVMMMMPEFWYASESAGTDKWKIWLADGDPKDGKKWKKWDHGHLIGVYEAYFTANKMHSISSKKTNGNYSQSYSKQYARNKGKGYISIDWQAHCIMAALFLAYYKNTNCQKICGIGTDSSEKTTGQTNRLGMTDTTSSDGNSMSINFWGLENWWGNKYEWIDNVTIDKFIWSITEPNGNIRTFNDTYHLTGGFISKLVIGEFLDAIPKQTIASNTTGYCDQYGNYTGGSCVVRRSCKSSDSNGGILYISANSASYYNDQYTSSRLAFIGEIEEADSVEAFLA